MSNISTFECPSCGSQAGISAKQKPQTYNEYVGQPCAGCGCIISDDDIKGWLRRVTFEAGKKVFKS